MNLKTERIDGHRARLTVEIDAERLESEKQKAARRISRQVRIRGFRKGKAPYRRVAQTVGEAAIIEEAIETLGDQLYKQALDESEVKPYGAGNLDDVSLDAAPAFVFTVPLQPEVELNDYLATRVDFEAPTISDEDVDGALRRLRHGAMEVVDDSLQVTGPGNRVTINFEGVFVDGDEPSEADESDEDPDAPYIPRKGDVYASEDDAKFILEPGEDVFIDGFIEALLDCELGSDVVFELTIPDDDAETTVAGRRVEFVATINEIEEIKIPDMDDEFAARVAKSRATDVADMNEFREFVRDEMERDRLERAINEYADEVIAAIVAGADIRYPEELLEDQIDEALKELEANLKRQGLAIDDYLRLTDQSKDDLREQHYNQTEFDLRRRLVAMEFSKAQGIELSDEMVDMQAELRALSMGDAPNLRELFVTPRMRETFAAQAYARIFNARLYAIGRGEDPDEAQADAENALATEVELQRKSLEIAKAEAEPVDDQPDEGSD